MTRIFKHLIRIIKHKYWVARYCFQLGLYWQGIVHDWSKFSYTEFSRSIKYWDDTISPLANEKNIHGYSETFLHHRGRNPHHYEFKKERNLETGRIESFEIEESKNCYYSTFVFIDDLCDAGGTFLGELKVLKERYPNSKFIIIVCHAVNDKGLINMCNNFDQVIVSNSHRDINYRPSNENLTVIDVCK